MTDSGDYPPFDEAVARFVRFIAAQGVPSEVQFVSAADVALANGRICIRPMAPETARRRARRVYERAAGRRLGVRLGALCRLEGRTCALVSGPESAEEASRLMYPDGLKMSIPTPLRDAVAVRGLSWWWAKLAERLSPARSMKTEWFR